jgi:DNA-damage-inducible protein D
MNNEIQKNNGEQGGGGRVSPFERIKRTNEAGVEFWSSRDFAEVLDYGDYRNFEGVVEKAKLSCFNSGQRVEDHFVDVTEMIEIGKGGQRPVKTIFMSRYACYLAIQNADPKKEIVALGQTYFAVQTRRQELADLQRTEQKFVVRALARSSFVVFHGAWPYPKTNETRQGITPRGPFCP